MSEDLDRGEAVAFILGERPKLEEDEVWAIINEIGSPPREGGDPLAVMLLAQTHPDIRRRTVEAVVAEWRAYAELARQRDWDDDEHDYINRFDD